jgi:hypothetical protein
MDLTEELLATICLDLLTTIIPSETPSNRVIKVSSMLSLKKFIV